MRMKDKISFVLGITALVHMFFFLGRWPHDYYYHGQLIATVFQLGWRFVTYKQAKYHYYLFDYCYVGNLVVWLYIYLYPQSLAWQRIAFAASHGPLLYSVGTMRNSLVFHSLDKLTSLYIHIVPPITMWNNIWYSAPETGRWAVSDPNENTISFLISYFGWSVIVYFLWAVLYYIKIFVVSSQKIKDRGYDTLFNWLSEDKE